MTTLYVTEPRSVVRRSAGSVLLDNVLTSLPEARGFDSSLGFMHAVHSGKWKESSRKKRPEKDKGHQNTLLMKQWLKDE